MTEVKPFIKCVDFWPVQIPTNKLEAYRQLLDEGQIRNIHVIYNRNTGSSTVEYYSTIPQEWIREELRKRAAADASA